MNKVLLVDDEQNVLNALRRELNEYFEIEAYTNPIDALEHCKGSNFDLVVADYQMPEMNGIEFLKQFGKLQPDAARLVLSGQADIDALIRTINETHIYRFLAKPWDQLELRSSIQQALNYRNAILESRRQAKSNEGAANSSQEQVTYKIVLVEPDNHLSDLMLRGLTDESGRESLYGAMQQEISQVAKPKQIRCLVDTFSSALAAISHIEKNHCDLVIAAQSLPDMDGIQLLNQLKVSTPNAARILLSDSPDKLILSQAINEAEVQSFLQLHWNGHELRTDMRRQAWNLYQLKTAAMQALAARDLLQGIFRKAVA